MHRLYRHYKNKYALEWARRNLPPQQYNWIYNSYKKTRNRTVVCVLCCMPIMLLFLFIALYNPFSRKAEAEATPYGATSSREARVDYDGNFYWTHDSRKYEASLADFGLDPDSFRPNDTVTIYIDDYQNVYKVTEQEEGLQLNEIELLVGTICAIVIPVIIITCIYVPIAITTFGKPWREYMKWFNKR